MQMQTDRPSFNVVCYTYNTYLCHWLERNGKERVERKSRKKERKKEERKQEERKQEEERKEEKLQYFYIQ